MDHQQFTDIAAHATRRDPVNLSKTWRRIFTKQATVKHVEQVADRFHMITLQSAGFKGNNWVAGQKVQIAMGSGFATRTYTPIDWNPVTGVARILGYAHGNGPASDWLSTVQPGDMCDVLGPSVSLDLERISGAIVVVGDETSIGLAYALQQTRMKVQVLLEVNAIENVQKVAQHLQLQNTRLVLKNKDGEHLYDMARELTKSVIDDATFVLTGNAQAIQHVRHSLKNLNVPSARQFTKAYWAERKTGLD